jgi:hypothetical protein
MLLNDPLGDRQTEPGSLLTCCKRVEYPAQVLRGNSFAAVGKQDRYRSGDSVDGLSDLVSTVVPPVGIDWIAFSQC